MTSWALSFGWNWLLVPAAVWFVRGVYVAWTRPWLRCVSVSKAGKDSVLISVERQERMPPWRLLKETYAIGVARDHWGDRNALAHREGDGWRAHDSLSAALHGILIVSDARERETEELSK